jgi:predicted hydrocarbon binding protein
MKGVIFNYLEDFIGGEYGLDKWEQLLTKCPMKGNGVFVGPQTYPDADFLAIVTVALSELGLDLDEMLRKFGAYVFQRLAADFPNYLEGYSQPKDFLLSVEDVIHTEVRKLMKGSYTPEFKYRVLGVNELEIQYHSRRRLCMLMEGILDGVGQHFDVPLNYEHEKCTRCGDEYCLFSVKQG